MCGRLEAYLISFSHLKREKDNKIWKAESGYRSPLLPLFLITLLDQIESGKILRNFISLNDELQNCYSVYTKLLQVPVSQSTIVIPFQDLGKTSFWELVPQPGRKSAPEKGALLTTREEFYTYYLGGRLSEDLYTLMQMPHLRKKLRTVLLESHFSNTMQTTIKNKSDI